VKRILLKKEKKLNGWCKKKNAKKRYFLTSERPMYLNIQGAFQGQQMTSLIQYLGKYYFSITLFQIKRF